MFGRLPRMCFGRTHGFAPAEPKKVGRYAPYGFFRWNTTVYLSGSSIFVIRSQPSRPTSLFLGLFTAFVEKTTSSASNGAPSDHFTPRRRCHVIVRPSLLTPPFACVGTTVASSGTGRLSCP